LSVFEQSLGWWEKLHRSEAFDHWLAELPKPAALFACNDTVGLKAAAARRLGLAVPGDLSILGVDNEDILCELSVPPLSSIALNLERIGWEAAKALASFMDGRPGREAAAVSTRTLATGDALVDRALGAIMARQDGSPLPGSFCQSSARDGPCGSSSACGCP
jgi:LacI family transcriptional regulator